MTFRNVVFVMLAWAVMKLCISVPGKPRDLCDGESCKCPPGTTGVQPYCRPIGNGIEKKCSTRPFALKWSKQNVQLKWEGVCHNGFLIGCDRKKGEAEGICWRQCGADQYCYPTTTGLHSTWHTRNFTCTSDQQCVENRIGFRQCIQPLAVHCFDLYVPK